MRKVDRVKRAELLARLRAEQSRRSARSTPTRRLEESIELLELCAERPTTDEPAELLLRMIADLRARER